MSNSTKGLDGDSVVPAVKEEEEQADFEEEIRRPLWHRGGQKRVNRKRGLAKEIAAQPRELLVEEFETDRANAPSRTQRDKRYFDEHRKGYPQCDVPSDRREENLMMALFNEGSIRLPDGTSRLWILDYQTPLCAWQDDGLGKIDATGLTPWGSLCLMELKAPRDDSGDSPLRALLECLSYAAAARANHADIVAEIRSSADRRNLDKFVDGRSTVLVFGPQSWWESWVKNTQAGDWRPPLADLSDYLAGELDIDIAYGAIEGFEFTKEDHGTRIRQPRIRGEARMVDIEGLPGLRT